MAQILAASGAAFATADADAHRWTIGNAAIRKTLAWREAPASTWRRWSSGQPVMPGNPPCKRMNLAGGEFALCWDDVNLSGRQATALHGAMQQQTQHPSRCASTCAWRKGWMSACSTASAPTQR